MEQRRDLGFAIQAVAHKEPNEIADMMVGLCWGNSEDFVEDRS